MKKTKPWRLVFTGNSGSSRHPSSRRQTVEVWEDTLHVKHAIYEPFSKTDGKSLWCCILINILVHLFYDGQHGIKTIGYRYHSIEYMGNLFRIRNSWPLYECQRGWWNSYISFRYKNKRIESRFGFHWSSYIWKGIKGSAPFQQLSW